MKQILLPFLTIFLLSSCSQEASENRNNNENQNSQQTSEQSSKEKKEKDLLISIMKDGLEDNAKGDGGTIDAKLETIKDILNHSNESEDKDDLGKVLGDLMDGISGETDGSMEGADIGKLLEGLMGGSGSSSDAANGSTEGADIGKLLEGLMGSSGSSSGGSDGSTEGADIGKLLEGFMGGSASSDKTKGSTTNEGFSGILGDAISGREGMGMEQAVQELFGLVETDGGIPGESIFKSEDITEMMKQMLMGDPDAAELVLVEAVAKQLEEKNLLKPGEDAKEIAKMIFDDDEGIEDERIFELTAAIRDMTTEELRYIQALPKENSIGNKKQFFNDHEAASYIADWDKKEFQKRMTNGSKGFQKEMQNRSRYEKAKKFLSKVPEAKNKFQELNPDLIFGEGMERTYKSSQGDFIYLPLGKSSFADEVISWDTEKEPLFPFTYVLGEPDYYTKGRQSFNYAPLGLHGILTLKFNDNALMDVNGPDLFVFELGGIEPTRLEISKDGENWIDVGKIDGGTAFVDISEHVKPGELFYYLRLTDLATHSAVPGADLDAVCTIGSAMRLNLNSAVLFDVGESALKPAGIAALEELALQMESINNAQIIVEGHTDDVGSESSNQKLSKARATSVSSELKRILKNGSLAFSEIGFGESKPIAENDNEKNRAKNRRVEILVLPKR